MASEKCKEQQCLHFDNKVIKALEYQYILMKDNDGNIIEGYRFYMFNPSYIVDIPIDIFNFIREL